MKTTTISFRIGELTALLRAISTVREGTDLDLAARLDKIEAKLNKGVMRLSNRYKKEKAK